ncbi:MAG: hypothetical protein JWL87_410 [Candidatus Adlerbacteria bacterium]|nr:hypothetical protein [Candidatus Adlerbacteria bacterium]
MQQLHLGIASTLAPPPLMQASKIILPEALCALAEPLKGLEDAYQLVLVRRKQPSANHPDPSKLIEAKIRSFELTLRVVEKALLDRMEKSSEMVVCSRTRDGISSLWTALCRYCADMGRPDAPITSLRDAMENVFDSIREIGLQQERL